MKLINADKLIDNLDNMIPATDDGDYAMGIATAIQEVGRMAYEDYIEAIPVEWIKDYVDFGVSDELAQRYRRFVLNMIKDWEKENEREID